jgi:hypothetical protein
MATTSPAWIRASASAFALLLSMIFATGSSPLAYKA